MPSVELPRGCKAPNEKGDQVTIREFVDKWAVKLKDPTRAGELREDARTLDYKADLADERFRADSDWQANGPGR